MQKKHNYHTNTIILNTCIWILLFISITLRFYKLESIPSDINQDEALTGYNAFSLLTTGKDVFGNSNPIYLIGWGSGTSILYTLLSKLSFYLFDISVFSLRLPQAFMGTLSCYIFYRLLRLFYSKQTSILGLFLIIISPWSIMTSRWGLDSNIAPSFCLLGFYFYCKSIKHIQYIHLSSIFYALTIYSYATYWPYIAIIYPLQLIYLHKTSNPKLLTKQLLQSFILFLLLISPILYFILVNYNILNELKLNYLSILKLPSWRGEELGINNLPTKLTMLYNILILQNDGWLSNTLPQYGLFYLFSPIFIIIGIICLFKTAIINHKNKTFSFSLIILIQIFIGVIYSSLIYSFSNRINFLYIPLLISITYAISQFNHHKFIFLTIILIYLSNFVSFTHTYFTTYNQKLSQNYIFSFSYGIKDALKKAEELHIKTNKDIYIYGEPYIYPKILFFTKTNPYIYQKTVKWYNYPDAFLQAKSFSHYHFINDDINIKDNQIYITHSNKKSLFTSHQIYQYGNYLVVSNR